MSTASEILSGIFVWPILTYVIIILAQSYIIFTFVLHSHYMNNRNFVISMRS